MILRKDFILLLSCFQGPPAGFDGEASGAMEAATVRHVRVGDSVRDRPGGVHPGHGAERGRFRDIAAEFRDVVVLVPW